MPHVQAYVGDKLGYQKEPIDRPMTIALTDAGAVDGADIISEVRRAISLTRICCFHHGCAFRYTRYTRVLR